MTYNELAQVLETKNPDTGKLYTLSDLNVFKMSSRRAPGCSRTTSSRRKWLSSSDEPGHARQVPEGVVPGLDLLPRPPGGVREHRAEERPDARRRAPGLADERDQHARLAEPERHRRRPGLGVAQTAAIAKTYGVIKKTPRGRDELHVREQGARAAQGGRGRTSTGTTWKGDRQGHRRRAEVGEPARALRGPAAAHGCGGPACLYGFSVCGTRPVIAWRSSAWLATFAFAARALSGRNGVSCVQLRAVGRQRERVHVRLDGGVDAGRLAAVGGVAVAAHRDQPRVAEVVHEPRARRCTAWPGRRSSRRRAASPPSAEA